MSMQDAGGRPGGAGRAASASPRGADDRPYTGRRAFRDLDDYAHRGAPPGFEMTLTGPETGPWGSAFVRFDRASVQFGTEGGPNVGHARIPERMAVYLVTLGGPAPICAGVSVGRTRIVVLGPGSDQVEAVRGPGRWATFSAAPDVTDLARARLGIPSQVFEPHRAWAVSVSRVAAAAVRAALARVERRLDGDPGSFDDPAVRDATRDALADCFVRAVAAGRRTHPRAGAAAAAHERILLASMRYLGAAQDHPVSISELVRAAGTSRRTLTRVFAEAFEVSPARFLRLRRTNQVRAFLRRGTPAPQTVTEAATRFGFYELGRFSGEYRRLFGELPSETLRRRDA